MNSKSSTIQSIILLFISLINLHQSIDCSCYTISGPTVTENNDGACFQYIIDSNSCTPSGELNIFFGVDTSKCYVDTLTLNQVLNSTVPDITINNGTGYQFVIFEPIQTIQLCLYGITKPGDGILNVYDVDNECKSPTDILPNYCGICNINPDESDACCGHYDQLSCNDGAKPTGDTVCIWDATNNRCITQDDEVCGDTVGSPCICFIDEHLCDLANTEGDLPCSWDPNRFECVHDNCTDTRSCVCYQTRQDCINIDDGEPYACVWDEKCVERTSEPTEIPSPEPTYLPTELPTLEPTEESETIEPTGVATFEPSYNTIDPYPAPTSQPSPPSYWTTRTETTWSKTTNSKTTKKTWRKSKSKSKSCSKSKDTKKRGKGRAKKSNP